MAEKKMTTMVLNVDLQCSKCFKKVKKILSEFPEIQEQVYDEKNNKVTIKVFSSSPERIGEKLCCKGLGCIKSIEILPPPKKEDQTAKKEKKEDPPPPPPPQVKTCCNKPCYEERRGRPCKPKPKQSPPPERKCCNECSGGPGYKPCYGYQAPIGNYGGYCGRPMCPSWGGVCGCGGVYYGCPCRGYYCEQGPSGCSVM